MARTAEPAEDRTASRESGGTSTDTGDEPVYVWAYYKEPPGIYVKKADGTLVPAAP